jgi:serine/threonine protein kinase
VSDFVGQKFGNYRLVRLLGQGGFADTYLGEQMYLKTEAAIKIVQTQLAQTDQEDFYSEARTIVRMKHPNIVRLLEFGVESSRNIPYLVMDYAPYGTLRQRHRRGEPLPIALVLSYVKQIAAALQYAHDHKVIHRDVKPENMLVGENNEILLSDFGIAVVQNTRSQLPQNIAGTMTYMAPEQIQGQPTAASDQYALAVVAYEWLCGVAPFTGSYTEVAIQHERTAPMPLRQYVPTIPADVEHIILTALAKDQNFRFSNVQAFAVALEHAAKVSPSSPPSPSVPSADSQMYLPTELTPQRNTPPAHSGYGIPPTPPGTQPSYGSQPPYVEHPYAPPSLYPVAQNSIIPPVSDPFAPKITPQFTPLPSSYPEQNAYTPQHAQQVQPQALPQTVTRPAQNSLKSRLSTAMIIVLAAALLLIVGGSVFAYSGVYLPYQRQVQATAAVNAQITETAQAYAKATTTARAQATATRTALMDVYTQATSGTPTISDPLNAPDNYGWTRSNSSGGKCDFVDGAYHSRAQVGYFSSCYAAATNFTDLAFQVEMTIISGTSGGIIFRGQTSGTYNFYVNTDGTYNLLKINDNGQSLIPTPLRSGSSAAIHTGLNQMNVLTVVTHGSTFYLYVNKQFVNTASDDSYKSGEIGVGANSSDTSGTEAVFRNVQVWQL